MLVDWCYATAVGTDVPVLVHRHADRLPARGRPGTCPRPRPPTSTSPRRCVAALMGERAPGPLRAFLRGCTLPAQSAPPAGRLAAARRTRRPARPALRPAHLPAVHDAGRLTPQPDRPRLARPRPTRTERDHRHRAHHTSPGGTPWAAEAGPPTSTTPPSATARPPAPSAFAYSDRSGLVPARQLGRAPVLEPDRPDVRESRDNDEHPASLAISVLFDVTGSMGGVPRVLQTKLPDLLRPAAAQGLRRAPADPLRRRRRRHLRPGPAAARPVRVRQPDGRAARQHPARRRGRRPDDRVLRTRALRHGPAHRPRLPREARPPRLPLPHRRRDALRQGQGPRGPRRPRRPPRRDIPLPAILAELRRKFHVFYILPAGASHAGNPEVLALWRRLLGQNVIELDDLDAVCETIALTVGLGEEAIDLAEGLADLEEIGSAAGRLRGQGPGPQRQGGVPHGARTAPSVHGRAAPRPARPHRRRSARAPTRPRRGPSPPRRARDRAGPTTRRPPAARSRTCTPPSSTSATATPARAPWSTALCRERAGGRRRPLQRRPAGRAQRGDPRPAGTTPSRSSAPGPWPAPPPTCPASCPSTRSPWPPRPTTCAP